MERPVLSQHSGASVQLLLSHPGHQRELISVFLLGVNVFRDLLHRGDIGSVGLHELLP